MNKKEQLKKQIKQKELQIKKLSLHKTSTEVCDQLYNALIMQKAILKKELDNLGKNRFVENIKKAFTKKEKLICDYFPKG